MQTENPNARPLTSEELEELDKLKALLERAIADGKITDYELRSINTQIHSDGQVLYEELQLYRQFILKKIESGELERDWDHI